MQHDPGYKRLYRAVAIIERRCCEDWRKKHFPSLTLEEAMSGNVKVLETTVASRPGGSTSVSISVISRKLSDCEVFHFSLLRKANRWYEQVLVPSITGIDQDSLSEG